MNTDKLPPWPASPSVIIDDNDWRNEWSLYHADMEAALRARLALACNMLKQLAQELDSEYDAPTEDIDHVIAVCKPPATGAQHED